MGFWLNTPSALGTLDVRCKLAYCFSVWFVFVCSSMHSLTTTLPIHLGNNLDGYLDQKAGLFGFHCFTHPHINPLNPNCPALAITGMMQTEEQNTTEMLVVQRTTAKFLQGRAYVLCLVLCALKIVDQRSLQNQILLIFGNKFLETKNFQSNSHLWVISVDYLFISYTFKIPSFS